MKLILSALSKMYREENVLRITKMFLQFLNKCRGNEKFEKVMKIRKSKCCGNLKSQSVLKEEKFLKAMRLTEQKSWNF